MITSDARALDLPHLGKAKLRDLVADALEQRILDGTFPVGERIPTETELGERFGVSRTAIRDALRVLEARGLVDIRRGSGTRVRATTVEAYANAVAMLLIRSDLTLGDVFDARAALDAQLIRLAAENHVPEDLQRIARALEHFEASVSRRETDETVLWHVLFHTELMRATHLKALNILLQPIQEMMIATSIVPPGADPHHPRSWRIEVHRGLFNAVASRDPAEAERAVEEHWADPRGPAYEKVRATRVGDQYRVPQELVRATHLDSWQRYSESVDFESSRAPPTPEVPS